MKKLSLLISYLVALSTSYAVPSLQINKIDEKTKIRSPFPIEKSAKWIWVENEDNVRVLKLEIVLKSEGFNRFQKVVTLSKTTQSVLEGNKLTIQLNGLSEKFLLKNEKEKIFFEVIPNYQKEIPVQDESCKKLQLNLQAPAKQIPFVLGTSCEKSSSGVTFALSFPHEIEFNSSTLFETKGKGEPWRFYALGEIKIASGTIGKFTFKYKEQSYDFVLQSIAPKAKDTPDKPQRISIGVGAGYGMLKLQGTDIDISDSKPLLILRVPHFPIYSDFGASLNIDIALPLSKGATSLTYTQFEMFGSYEFALGNAFKLRPKAGYVVFSESHDTSRVGLSGNQIGFGLNSEYLIGTDSFIILDIMLCGLGSTVIKTHYALNLSYLNKKKSSFGWGGGIKLQSYKATGDLSIERQFNQTLFYALIAF